MGVYSCEVRGHKDVHVYEHGHRVFAAAACATEQTAVL